MSAAGALPAIDCASTDGLSIVVMGKVTRLSTGAPLPGALVRLEYTPVDPTDPGLGGQDVTDGTGAYEISANHVPCRDIRLIVTLGFRPVGAGVECTNRPQQIDVAVPESSIP